MAKNGNFCFVHMVKDGIVKAVGMPFNSFMDCWHQNINSRFIQ
jgi:hypothetical protein